MDIWLEGECKKTEKCCLKRKLTFWIVFKQMKTGGGKGNETEFEVYLPGFIGSRIYVTNNNTNRNIWVKHSWKKIYLRFMLSTPDITKTC